jgi:hypothetical protein
VVVGGRRRWSAVDGEPSSPHEAQDVTSDAGIDRLVAEPPPLGGWGVSESRPSELRRTGEPSGAPVTTAAGDHATTSSGSGDL